jgi:hypothetical protein
MGLGIIKFGNNKKTTRLLRAAGSFYITNPIKLFLTPLVNPDIIDGKLLREDFLIHGFLVK